MAPKFAANALLKERIAADIDERLATVRRRFARVLDLGAHDGRLSRAIAGRLAPDVWIVHADSCPAFARMAPPGAVAIVVDEESLPFAEGGFDLVVSAMSLHWVSDLPGALCLIRQALAPDGLFVGALIGGESLSELRACLLEAEVELTGGAVQRVSPFAGALDLAELLQRAGFAMPVADTDRVEIIFSSPRALLETLRGMGESAAPAVPSPPLRRDVLERACRLYETRFSHDGGGVTARFDIVTATGWSPGPGQPRPGPPGFVRSDRLAPGGLRERSPRSPAR